MKDRNGGYNISSLELKLDEGSIVLDHGVILKPEDVTSAENIKRLIELLSNREGKKEGEHCNSGWEELIDYGLERGHYHLYAFGIGPNGHFSFIVYSSDLKTYRCELHISPKIGEGIFDYILGGEE